MALQTSQELQAAQLQITSGAKIEKMYFSPEVMSSGRAQQQQNPHQQAILSERARQAQAQQIQL